MSPSTTDDVVTTEERSSSTNEIANAKGGRPNRKLSQQDGQSERDGSTQKSSGRKRKRHGMIGPMLPPTQTPQLQQGDTEQAKVSVLGEFTYICIPSRLVHTSYIHTIVQGLPTLHAFTSDGFLFVVFFLTWALGEL